MKTYVALFRGINVGGRNILAMSELRELLTGLGAREVRTYIQSGNAVFQSVEPDPKGLAGQLRAAVRELRGFEPHILVLDAAELATTVADNPFPEAISEPKTLHVWFLDDAPEQGAIDRLSALKADSERFRVLERRLYLHAPEGIGCSRLAAGIERTLGMPVTARNWNTVCKLYEMAGQGASMGVQVV